MNQSKRFFKKDFFWGASTSSHQIEGGLKNNWTEWEEKNIDHLVKRSSKRAPDHLSHLAKDPEVFRSNSKYSCDSFDHWKEDIKVIKEMGLNSYRFSLEWSRIEPEKGVFSEEGIKYYIDLVKELRKNNIEPVVTIWHWTLPVWLSEEGGVLSPKFFSYWDRYVEYVVDALYKNVKYWIPINEPTVVASMSYLKGEWPPAKKNPFFWLRYLFFVFPKSHKSAYRIIKKKSPNSLVSMAHQMPNFEAYKNTLLDRFAIKIANYLTNFIFLDMIRKYMDFIAINFYFNNLTSILGGKNTNDVVTDVGWWYRPEKLEDIVKKLYKRYKLPIMVTENGLADSREILRKDWIGKSITALRNCAEDGIDVIGYLHWSLLDNFEWAEGFWPQFGLVSVDPKTKERHVKDSGWYYRDLIEKERRR